MEPRSDWKILSPPEEEGRAGGRAARALATACAEGGEGTGQSSPLPAPRRHILAQGPPPQLSPEPSLVRALPANSSRGSGTAAWSAAASGTRGPIDLAEPHYTHTPA